MKKIAIIYWPKKGNVETAAHKIYELFDKDQADIFTITGIDISEIENYDYLIIGNSTTGADNWEDTHKTRWVDFFKSLDDIDLKDKPVAIFGLGDQILYPYNFVDGIAWIKDELVKHGIKITGHWPVEGYEFRDSKAVEDDHFLGLALDNDQQPELTDERITGWVNMLKKEWDI